MDDKTARALAAQMGEMVEDLKKLLGLQVKVYGELAELLARLNAREKREDKERAERRR